MIVKQFNLKNKIKEKINFYLLYGQNSGLIDETIDSILKPNFSKNIFYYDEIDLLSKIEEFKEEIFNKSFFENDKLIIISRATDKILQGIEDIIQIQNDDLKIIIKTSSLEKKSKLRNYFEKNKDTIIVPFYEDTHQSLIAIAQKFFYEKKIKISNQNINFIIERVKGNRINLKNELEKIYSLSLKKNVIEFEEIMKLTNLAENYSISELADQCLVKNKKKTLNILNENNSTHEDNILIIKTFLYKLKRLKWLKKELQIKNNSEDVISSYRPPIFWKDKDLIRQQLKIWSLPQILSVIKEVNNIEMLIKKNSQISNVIINNFILDKLD